MCIAQLITMLHCTVAPRKQH